MTRSQNTPSIIQKDLDGDEWRDFLNNNIFVLYYKYE